MKPTERFSDRAGAYSIHRPGYPSQVFEALFDGMDRTHRLRVADIGAGTGISTALLADRVAHVVAVEPNAAMRDRAVNRPNVTWVDAAAEHTGLDDKSVDVAAAFQAFHWFDAEKAFAEMARIARSRIGIVQYERDETQAPSAAYGALVRRFATDDTEDRRMRGLDAFARLSGTRLRRVHVSNAQSLTFEGLLGRVASASYMPKAGPHLDAMHGELRLFFDRFAQNGRLEMAMTVYVLTTDV